MAVLTDCPKCHQDHEVCKGHNRAGGPCRLSPRRGMVVCRLHGGESPQALEGARRREVEERAREVLRRKWADGLEPTVTDPLGELARIAGEVVAFKDYLRDQVTELDGVLTYWTDREYPAGDDVTRTEQTEQLRAVVTAYERSLDRAAKVLASIVKLDLAGRMLELRTAQAEQIVGAVRYGLAQVDMAAEVRRGAEAAIADALAGITAGHPALD